MRHPYSYAVEVTPELLEMTETELQEHLCWRLANLDILPSNITYRLKGRDITTVPFTGTVLNIVNGSAVYDSNQPR
jgi:hypothetical protein